MIEISSLHEKALKRLSQSIQYKNDKNKYKDIILKSRGIFLKGTYTFLFLAVEMVQEIWLIRVNVAGVWVENTMPVKLSSHTTYKTYP